MDIVEEEEGIEMDCVKPVDVKVPIKEDSFYSFRQPLDQRKYRIVQVPCGVCIACRIAKTREWTARLMMENDSWSKSGFLTLTYDDDHLPMTSCGNMTLVPKHLSDFLKRSRKFLHDHDECSFHGFVPEGKSPPLLRYFACGEYGDHTGRPHYHAVIFGFGSEDRERLERLWTFGFVRIDPLTPERCDYCAGYVQKKIFRDPRKYWDEYGCRQWPFQRQSQALALSYYTEHKSDFKYADYRIRMHGVSYTMPRYFGKKDEKLQVSLSIISERQRKKTMIAEQKAIDRGYDIYASRTQREKDLNARNRLYKKGNL